MFFCFVFTLSKICDILIAVLPSERKKEGIYRCLLARCKGLEPLTYWFVASHSIQLS